MSKTPEVTARSRNCRSWLAPTLEEAGREIPEARGPAREPRCRDWTLSWGKQGAPEESWAGARGCECSLNWSGGRAASKGAEGSGRRLRSRAWLCAAAAAGPSVGLGGRFRSRGRVRASTVYSWKERATTQESGRSTHHVGWLNGGGGKEVGAASQESERPPHVGRLEGGQG